MKNTLLKLGIFIAFLGCHSRVIAQRAKLDSLQQVLKTHTKADTTRVNVLTKAAKIALKLGQKKKSLAYINEAKTMSEKLGFGKGIAKNLHTQGLMHAYASAFDEARKYLWQALKAFENINDIRGASVCFYSIALTHYYQSAYADALKYFKKSLQLAESINNIVRITDALNGAASAYADLGKNEQALGYYQRALQIHSRQKNEKGMATCFNNMGTVCDDQGNILQASEYYHKALELYQKVDYPAGASKALNNLAIIYKNQKNYAKALKYFSTSLKINTDLLNKRGIAHCTHNMGLIYKKKKQPKKAMKYLNQALKMSRKLGDRHLMSKCLVNMADITYDRKNYDLAQQYYLKSLAIKQAIDDQRGISLVYLGLGDIFIRQKNFHKALDYVLRAQKIANKGKINTYQRDAHESLAEIYSNLGQHKKAYENQVAYKKLYDEIFNKKNIQKITQLEYEYKYKKKLTLAGQKEQELTEKIMKADLKLAKSQKETLQAIVGFLVFIIVSGVVIIVLVLRGVKLERKQMMLEQKLLRSQMTPHFIFNALAVLQGIIMNKEYKKSLTYLSKFSRLLRIILENSRDRIVPLEKELKAIENYLVVQNLGTKNPYNYSIDTGQDIDLKKVQIPPMIIQPFVENAIEHGFAGKKDNRQISIALHFDNKQLRCSVADNGVGITPYSAQENKQKKSLATTITSERLKMFAKEFKVKTDLNIQNRSVFNEEGTIVTLVLPYKIRKDD